MRNPFRYFKTSPEIIRLAVMMYIRFPLSLRNVEDLLHERELLELGLASRRGVVKINGELHYLWRAVDHKGEVLEAYVTKTRHRKAALRFLRKAMKRYGRPDLVVTDRLGSYKAAMREIGNASRQKTERWLNNRAENSHQPFRRREKIMNRFRSMRSLQKFAAVQSSVHNHFNLERHFYSRSDFKENRVRALAEWRQLAA